MWSTESHSLIHSFNKHSFNVRLPDALPEVQARSRFWGVYISGRGDSLKKNLCGVVMDVMKMDKAEREERCHDKVTFEQRPKEMRGRRGQDMTLAFLALFCSFLGILM